jgi:RNA polymerase sigma-70 factor (ECF subfamily)
MTLDDDEITRAHREGRALWSEVDLPLPVYLAHVRQRATGATSDLELTDLYLACACLHGVPNAVERTLAAHAETLDAVARRLGLSPESRDDLRQILGERLFVGGDGAPPRIEQYTGSGTLRSWLKAVATRIALDLVRRSPRDQPANDDTLDERLIACIADPPDVRLQKESDRRHLRLALTSAFAELEQQEKNLLRYALLDDLGIDELARIYAIHRATAARRLVAARDRLATGARRWLQANLRLDASACASLVREGLSQVDLTLGTTTNDPEPGP